MISRLEDLHSDNANGNERQADDLGYQGGLDEEAPPINDNSANADAEGAFMEGFFQAVDRVHLDISVIARTERRIRELTEETCKVMTEEEERSASSSIREAVAEGNTAAQSAKDSLSLLKSENSTLPNSTPASSLRIRKNLVSSSTVRFVRVAKRYKAAQQRYHDALRDKVTRQVRIVKPDASEVEVDDILRDGSTHELYKEAILGVDAIKGVMQMVRLKYQDVITLERTVGELNAMFLDMAILVEMQGEKLDSIEYNVRSSAAFIEDANVELEGAIDYQRRIRRKKCCILVVVLIALVLVVVLPITLT